MTALRLPRADGSVYRYELCTRGVPAGDGRVPSSRVAFAAAHVVADPLQDTAPGAPAALDWDATLAVRRHLFSYGLGVAEAMDTAQRGMGLDWSAAQELIRRSAEQANELGARIAAGAGTDQLPDSPVDVDTVAAAYEEQLAFVESTGSQPILMASRALVAAAADADDYLKIYDRLIRQARSPVILHWLGEAFDPRLRGYWGSADIPTATATFLDLVTEHADRIDGVKVSLLDAAHETQLRSSLPTNVRLYTGDDFNYPELIRGDGERHSDALLGVFAAIAPAAAAALQALDAGDTAVYDRAFAPTLPLARHLFTAPTFYYKTGIAFLSWLSGRQPAFSMVGGLSTGRSLLHLVEAFTLADAASLLPDAELAADRMRSFLAVYGVAA